MENANDNRCRPIKVVGHDILQAFSHSPFRFSWATRSFFPCKKNALIGMSSGQKRGPRGSSLPELTKRTIFMLRESNPDYPRPPAQEPADRQERPSGVGSGPQVLGPGVLGGSPPRKRNWRTTIPSVRATSPSSSASLASRQGGAGPAKKR